MKRRITIFKIIFLIVFSLIFLIPNSTWSEEKKYYPYPIIFIHGIGSDSRAWDDARIEFSNYFYIKSGSDELKYFPVKGGYLRVYDYRDERDGDISSTAQGLEDIVSNALDSLPLPDDQKKVIIVTHSMGGIVPRSFLKQYSTYEDKIDKIVFIGVPHEGSPLASIVILVKREIPNLKDAIRQNWAYGALDLMRVILNPVTKKDVRSYYHTLVSQITKALLADYTILETVDKVIHIDHSKYNPRQIHNQGQGVAVGQLVVPETVIATRTFDEGLGKLFPITLPPSLYQKYDTFLNLASDNLSVPPAEKNRTVFGTGGDTIKLLEKILIRDPIIPKIEGFPKGNGIEDLFAGDAVVSRDSQRALTSAEEYGVNVWHSDEPKQWQTILQAIEDDPVIESVRAVPENWNATPEDNSFTWYYLIFKLKDYLLADIEIESLTLDGQDKIPASFKKDNIVKPYNALGQRFLQDRYCNDEQKELAGYYDIFNDKGVKGVKQYLHLMPGEFSIRTQLFDGQALYIKIKNPAAQYNSDPNDPKFTAKKTFYVVQPKVNVFWTLPVIDVQPYIDYPIWPRFSALYFNIQDSPTKDIRLNAWLYNETFKAIPRKFKTAYTTPIPWTSSRDETLPDGQTTITLHSGGFDINHLFAAWYGIDDNGRYVPPYPNNGSVIPYYLKVTVGPSDAYSNDNLIFLLGFGLGSISADPTFIQPSRRESVTW